MKVRHTPEAAPSVFHLFCVKSLDNKRHLQEEWQGLRDEAHLSRARLETAKQDSCIAMPLCQGGQSPGF